MQARQSTPWTVQELAHAIGLAGTPEDPLELRVLGDAQAGITRLGSLVGANPGTLSYAVGAPFRSALQATQATCVILGPALEDLAAGLPAAIIACDPLRAFAALTRWWVRQHTDGVAAGIHASAVVDPRAQIGAGVVVGPLAVVEADAVLGDGVIVGPHSFVGARTRLGAQTRLHAHVVVHHDCVVGQRCIFHSGVVVGADGFGFAPHRGHWEKIEQLGGVRIGDDVDLGANTCVDRGALDDTVLEDGVKIDNLVQIAHNVHIGAHTAMAACVGIAGSTRLGSHCTVGGAAMFVGHITLTDHVHVSGGTLISRSIHQPGHYSGSFPFDDHAAWEKNAATLRQLSTLRERIRTLEKLVKT